jgi:hypothetical protein
VYGEDHLYHFDIRLTVHACKAFDLLCEDVTFVVLDVSVVGEFDELCDLSA